jgi:WD40 repeat protein
LDYHSQIKLIEGYHVRRLKLFALLSTACLIASCTKGPESQFQLATQGLLSGALSHNAELAVIGSIHHGGSLWDLKKNERLFSWNHAAGELSSIRAASISGNGKYAVTTVEDSMVLWSTETGKSKQFWQAPARIISITLNWDGSKALMGLRDGSVNYFNMNSGSSIHNFKHGAEVRSTGLSKDGLTGISGSDDKTAKVWDLKKGALIFSMKLSNQIKNVSISASGELAFTTAQREDSIVWKTKTGDIKFRSPNRYTNYTASTFSEDESYISVGTFQGEIKRWNIETGKETGNWQAAPRKAYGSAASKAISSIVDTKKKIIVLTSDGLTQTFKPQ